MKYLVRLDVTVRSAAARALFAAGLALSSSPAPADEGAVTILDGSGVWRVLHSWDRPMVQTDAGPKPRVLKPGRYVQRGELETFRFMTVRPPPGWTGADFDDSAWPRRHFLVPHANGEWDHRAGGGQASPLLRQLSLRGRFTVTDPGKAGSLRLTLGYRGGAVAYVNGTELARGHLPAGDIQPGGLAKIYPLGAYLKGDGKPWHWWTDAKTIGRECYPLRVRRLQVVPVPQRLLRKGANVLAVEIHAAPYPAAFAGRNHRPEWATCGLVELRLQADSTRGIVANVVRPEGVQVWNTNPAEEVHDIAWADPHEALGPVRLVAPRNGCGSGRVVVGSDRPMKDLRATVGPLATADGNKLPASAVVVRYGRFDPLRGSRWGGAINSGAIQWGEASWRRDDALLESAPEVVEVATHAMPRGLDAARRANGLPAKLADGALQPVWVVAEVPRDASAGEYRGTLTITLDGGEPIRTPVVLTVADWALPDPADYACFLGMIQCFEGPALTYDVPLLSPRHRELLARSFRWIGRLGPKVLFLPLTAESQYGNAQSLVLWRKDASGTVTHDFARVEAYVDLALKHMGRPRLVVLGVWDSCMHISAEGHRRKYPMYTVLDAATGKTANARGPVHGTGEAEAFWRPVLHGVRERLAKRGLGEAMLLGYCADRAPQPAAVAVFHRLLPGVGWQATRHPPLGNDALRYDGGTVPIRYQANVWGGWDNWDPAVRRPYGWKYPLRRGLRVWLDRDLFDASSIVQFRTACEQALLADRRGLGQIGADFWPVPPAGGRRGGTMVGRFPATSEGNLGIYAGQLLHPGPSGPVPSVRYQMMRENLQECEARIFLEKLLTAQPCPLPAELARKCQALLDERTRWHRMRGLASETAISWPYSGWQARTRKLYEAAAGAAKALKPKP